MAKVTIVPTYPQLLLKDMRVTLQQLGQECEAEAKALAPVLTGALRQSITTAGAGNKVYVGSDLDYAGTVEYGTSSRPAQPYLRPALIKVRARHKA